MSEALPAAHPQTITLPQFIKKQLDKREREQQQDDNADSDGNAVAGQPGTAGTPSAFRILHPASRPGRLLLRPAAGVTPASPTICPPSCCRRRQSS